MFVVKPGTADEAAVSGIGGRQVVSVEAEVRIAHTGEGRDSDKESGPIVQPLQLVEDLAGDPEGYDRQAVEVVGEVVALAIEEGEKPYTKFKLRDASGEIPVFMLGVQPVEEGGSYELDGVFLVKPARDGSGSVHGVVGRLADPVAEDAPISPQVPVAVQVSSEPESVSGAPQHVVHDLLSDQSRFDRRLVSVTGKVTTLTTRYGDRIYQKFRLTDQSGTIPVYVPGTTKCRQGQVCRVTGVFLTKTRSDGSSEVSGIKADAVVKVDDVQYRERNSLVFQDRAAGTRTSGRLPRGYVLPE